MNKRQRKKNDKKQELFAISFVNSYKELKQIERQEHEWWVSERRKRQYNHVWDVYLDDFEDI